MATVNKYDIFMQLAANNISGKINNVHEIESFLSSRLREEIKRETYSIDYSISRKEKKRIISFIFGKSK